MINQLTYAQLYKLADRHIPEGRHKMLHVDSREAWINLMIDLLEKQRLSNKAAVLRKCAVGWELLLTQRLSTLN